MLRCGGAVLVGADVVDIENVDARQAQALQAVLERAHDAVMRIVVDDVERQRVPALERGRGPRHRAQQPPDLGRQYPVVTRLIAQRVADGALGLADAVKGCGVDIAHAGRPGGAHDRLRGFAADRDAGAAEGGGAEPQYGHFERGMPDPAPFEIRHVASPWFTP